MNLRRALVLALAVLAAGPAASAYGQSYTTTVSEVVDGDTIRVRSGDPTGETTVRLIGIDTPETKDPNRPVECGGREATEFLESLVDGQTVTLTVDPTQDRVDRFGRTLAYVDVGSTDVGLEIIRAGWSQAYVYAKPFQRFPQYQAAEQEAGDQARGAWDSCAGEFHSALGAADLDEESPEDTAERFVRRHYFRLNEHKFAAAWGMFGASLRRRLGPRSWWQAGYRRTIGTRVNMTDATVDGTRAVVRVAIRARDRDACNGKAVTQFFRGRWSLRRSDGRWFATKITMRKVGGGRVRLAKSACPKPKPKRRRSGGAGEGGGGGGGGAGCHPSYSPCVPNDRDYDCGELPGSDYIVSGPDDYRLDGDNDGYGCES